MPWLGGCARDMALSFQMLSVRLTWQREICGMLLLAVRRMMSLKLTSVHGRAKPFRNPYVRENSSSLTDQDLRTAAGNSFLNGWQLTISLG